MKTKLTKTLALIAAVCGLNAFAATPKAVWDGDFNTATKSGWTLSLKSGTALPTAAGNLALAADVLKLTSANTKYANGAIIIRYSGYTANSLANTALGSAYISNSSEGGCEANGGVLKTYYDTSVNRSLNTQIASYPKDNIAVPSSGYLILAYNTSTGTAAFMKGTGDASWKGGYDSGIKWSSQKVHGFSVAGPWRDSPADTMGPCATMTIEAVAVFENYNAFTQSGIEGLMAYKFPTEPLAVWDGDFTGAAGTAGAVRGDFTIRANGNTLASDNGKITIATDHGVLVDWASSLQTAATYNGGFADNNITMLVRYTNMAGRSDQFTAVGTIWHSDTATTHEDYVGVMADKTTAGTPRNAYGINDAASWSGGESRAAFPAPSESTYTMALVYNPASRGTECYVSTDGTTFTQQFGATKLKTTTAKHYLRGAAIGGARVATLPASNAVYGMTGLNIEKVAVFNAPLTAEQIAAYKFPSEKARVISLNVANTSTAGVIAEDDTMIDSKAGRQTGRSWNNVGYGTNNHIGSTTNVKVWNGSTYETITSATVSWSSTATDMANLWNTGITALPYLQYVYARKNGTGLANATWSVTSCPFAQYDVIVYFSGSASEGSGAASGRQANQAVTINGKTYVGDTNVQPYGTKEGTGAWGSVAESTTTYGKNVLRVNNLTGDLTVKIESSFDHWGIAAIQLVERPADVVSVNFGTTGVGATPGTVGGVAAGGWMDIVGGSAAAVNGTRNLYNGDGAVVGSITVSVPQDPWGPASVKSDTLAHIIQSSYFDLGANNKWTLSASVDYLVSDVILYMSGDGNKFSPVKVNGSNYIGGTDVAAGSETSWGTRTYNTDFTDQNTIRVTKNIGGSYAIENVPQNNTSKRGTICGIQVIDTTDKYMYYGTVSGAATTALVCTKQDGTSSTLANIPTAARILTVKATGDSASLALDGETIRLLIVESGKLTISGTPTIDRLIVRDDAELTIADSVTITAALTANAKITGGITFQDGATVTFGTNGSIEVPQGQTVDWQTGITNAKHRELLAKTTGDGTLKMKVGGNVELQIHSDTTPLTANVNIVYTGTASTLYFVGSDEAGVDQYTVSAGKTVTYENGTIWPKRSVFYVYGTLIAKHFKLGHESDGKYTGKITVYDGATVKTESVTFMNKGGSSGIDIQTGGVFEFLQNDSSAIALDASDKTYSVQLNGGTFKADASSWFVGSDIAMTVAGGAFDAAEGKTITIAGPISGSGNVSITGAGEVILNGTHTDTGTYTVAEGAKLTLGTTRTMTIAGASAGTITLTLTDDEKTTLDGGAALTNPITISGDAFAGTIKAIDGTGADYPVDFSYESGTLTVTKKKGARMSPYNVTNPTNETWTIAGWMDSTPTKPLEVRPEDWDNKVSANVTVEAGQEKALTTDRALTLGTLTLSNAGTLTVSANGDNTLAMDTLTVNNTGALNISGGAISTLAIDDTASTGATTIGFDIGALPLTAGANTILTTAGTGHYTIPAEKMLTVKGGALKASQISNSGTLNFVGGTAAEPISITGDADFEGVTLGANTFVKFDDKGTTRKYAVTGSGASSVFTLARNAAGNAGITKGSSFANLTFESIATGTGNNSLWLEKSTIAETVGLKLTGAIKLNTLTPDPVVLRGLSGSAELTNYDGKPSGVTIRSLEDNIYAGTCELPITIDAASFTQTFSGNYTGALTVNAGGKVKLTGSAAPSSVANAGTVIYDVPANTTNFVAYAITGEGTIEIVGGGTVIFKDSSGVTPNTTITETSGKALFGKTVDINNLGKYTPVAPYTTANVVLLDQGGNAISSTVVGDHLEYTWDVEGKNCWWDYEFNGTLTNTGTDTTTVHDELTDPYYNSTSNALRVGYATPWTNVSAYPDEFTAVLYGKMVDHTNHVEMAFGSTTGGTTINVAIMCGDPTAHEVKLTIAEAFVTKKTVTMNVPNAYTADHLYAFVCKTINDGGTEKTKVIVYLDGIEWDSYTFPTKVTLGTGFQIGSVHGAVPSGCVKSNTDDKNADLDWLRVYSTVLTAEAMTKYAGRYPYESTNGSAKRTFATAAANWTETNAWKVKPYQQEELDADKPTPNAIVTIDANVDTTVTFDLNESAAYEQFNVQGESAISLKAGGTVAPTVSGLTTIGTDVTNEWNAIGIGKVMVTEGNTLTFDFTSFPFGNYFKGATNEFTGAVSGAGAVAAIIPDLTGTGRTATFAPNEYGHYALVITVDTTIPFVYTINKGAETGVWTWGKDTTDEATVLAQSSATIKKAGDGTQSFVGKNKYTYEVDGGTLKFTNTVADVTSTITVNEGATFDMNGLVDSHYDIVLNGGTLANYGATIPFNKRQIRSITLTKDSSIAAVSGENPGNGSFCFVSDGYATNTLDLATHSLTKKGDAQFVLMNTVVTNGTVVVETGQLRINAPNSTVNHTVFTNATLTIQENGTLYVGRSSLTIDAITGEGGTIEVASSCTLSPFTLSGTLTLTGDGNYGTITMVENAVADVGTRHNLTFAGKGTVNLQLTQAEINAAAATAFTKADDDTTTAIGTVVNVAGDDVTTELTIAENEITYIPHRAKIGNNFYITFADAIKAANAMTDATTVFLVENAAVTEDMVIDNDVTIMLGTKTLDFGTVRGKTLKAFAGYGTITATVTDEEVTAGTDVTLFTLTGTMSSGVQVVAKKGETTYPTYFDPATGTLTITPATIPTPKSWYEFNGNATVHEGTTGIISGDTDGLLYHASPHGGMMETTASSGSPYINDRGSETEWTVVTFARAVNSEHKMIWTFGTSGGGIGLASDGANGVRAGRFNANGILTGERQYVRVENINSSTKFHCYALTMKDGVASFYVDGVLKGTFDDTNNYSKGQIGGVHGGSDLMRADGTRVDDWRLYTTALRPAFIKQIADEFTVWPAYKSPLTYTISANQNLSTTTWADSSDTPVEVNGAYWPNLTGYDATLTVSGDATLTADVSMGFGTMTIASDAAYAFTLTKSSGKTITGSVNDSASTGTTTLDFAPVNVTAGTDTVVKGTGTGTLTIAAGKKATIPGWTDAATKITGAGDLVVDTGAKATEFQVASFTYTGKFTMKQGTWNAATAFPKTRANMFFDGENALMKVSGGDKTGYSDGLPKIHFLNGATLQFVERDTFSRELVLSNAAHVVVNAHNTGRGLDFFSNAKLSVYGAGMTSTIGGTTAGTIENAGIISIRRDMEVLVDADATLDVWSQWGFNSEADALTRAVTKTGAGTVIFHRPSPQTGKFSVEGGTLKLVDAGSPTLGEIALSGGTTLELNTATEQTVANTITGAGAIKKTGEGTTKLTGENTFTGGTSIEAGVLFANHVALGTGTITIANDAKLKVDLDDYATVVETTEKIFNFSGDLKEGQLIVLNQNKYPWIKISTSGTDLGKVVVEKAKIPFTGLHIHMMMPKATSKLVDRDPNGRTAGWIDLVNYGPTATNLANYKIVRSNLGKKVKVTGDDAIAPLLDKEMAVGETFRVYTSEDYETAEDYGGTGTEVAWFKTVEGVVTKLNAYKDGAIMVVPQKVNPKKYPMVRLYSFVDDTNYSVIDEVIVPCDLDDNLEIEFVANTNKIERNIVYTDGTKVAYGPDVSQLYGGKIDDKVYPIGDLALLKPTGFAAVGAPYEVGFPVNPFMTDGKALDANKIDSVKLVYRVFDPDNVMTEEEVAMSAKELSGDDKKVYGTLWTNAIPASVMSAANKGKLVQFRAKITDKGGATFCAPRNANPDVGYEWYGVVVQPEVTETVSSAELASTAVCTNRLQTFLMFVCGESKTQMDKDIDSQDRTKVPYGARIAVYDTQTHTYYDNVRIDLRGQTSASFLKKSHGLRFSKVAPLTCVDPFTGDECAFRKTSFIAEYGDPAFIRQTLALRVMRESGVKAPFDYPVRLYLNGTFYQLAFHSNRFTDEIVEDYYGLNPYGYAFKNVHQLTQGGGGAEKKTPDDDNESDLSVLNEYAARIESQTPAAGVLTTDAIRHFNIPSWVNYLAAVRVTQEADDVWTNLGIYINKYEYFHNPNGDDTMMPLAYDQNLSFGMWYRGDDSDRYTHEKGIVVTNDLMKSHPFYGGRDVRYHQWGQTTKTYGDYNRGMEVILQNATFREMLVRRIRTLAEKYLGGPTTAQADTELWKWISEYKTAIKPDVAADHAKWDYAHIGKNDAHASAIWIWPSEDDAPTFQQGIDELWEKYITQRRIHLYDYHAAKNVGTEGHPTEIGYATEKSAGIPETQAATETFGKHGALYFTDLNGNKPGEADFDITTDKILGIVNTNNVAIDVSDWTVEGAVVATFKPGTVIPTNSVLWIVEDRPAAAESIITNGIGNPVVVNLDKTLVDKKGNRLEYFDTKCTDQLSLKDADGTPAISYEATIGTKYYITLLDAFNCAKTDDIVTLLTDINNQSAAAVKTSVILYGDTNTLTGAGFDVAEGQTLTIASGQIANGALGASPTRIVLMGGKYTEAGKTAYTSIVSNQYHFAHIGTAEGDYQVIPGAEAADDEIVLPVAQVDTTSKTNDTGVLAFSKKWLKEKGFANEDEDFSDVGRNKTIAGKLNERQTNKIQAWENKVLGLDGSQAINIPVIAPVQTADPKTITFKIGNNVTVDKSSGAIVTYRVLSGTDQKSWNKASAEALYTEPISFELPTKGVQYYKLEVITTPAK